MVVLVAVAARCSSSGGGSSSSSRRRSIVCSSHGCSTRCRNGKFADFVVGVVVVVVVGVA